MKGFVTRKVFRFNEKDSEALEDAIASEKRLRILVNGKELLKLYCSPVMIRELVVGFLMTEEIMQESWCADRMTIEYGEDVVVDVPAEGEVSLQGGTITSGCVGGVTFERTEEVQALTDNLKIEKEKLRDLFSRFQKSSELYNVTGCVHSAALSDGNHIIVLAEDIGRHNAVDKVFGYCVLESIPVHDKLMIVSGRLSSEMASKCSRWGVPVVLSRTAPTALAIEIAERRGITMIGFMRGKRFNVYSHPHRIV
jgi:FdhD protein